MKILVNFLAAILLTFCTASAQEGLLFKMQYKPQVKYNQFMQQSVMMEINYSGSKEMMDALEAQGTKNPTVNKMEISVESAIKTGKMNDSSVFPISMEFTKLTNNDVPTVATGTAFFGHCSMNKQPVYDSVYSPDGKEAEAKKMAELISKALTQISFPDKKMKPGDEFRQEVPFSLPIGATKIDMNVVTVYKLKSIKDNIGFFDVNTTYEAKINAENIDVPLKGSGKGKLEFDAAGNFFRYYEINIDTETKMNVQGMDMKIISIQSLIMRSNIEKI